MPSSSKANQLSDNASEYKFKEEISSNWEAPQKSMQVLQQRLVSQPNQMDGVGFYNLPLEKYQEPMRSSFSSDILTISEVRTM